MDFVFVWLFVIGCVLVGMLLRPFTVLLHELGHAAAALLLTSNPITVYIGSYGDPENSRQLRLGRLQVFFAYHPLMWRLGLCQIGEVSSLYRHALIILAGPLASLVLALLFSYLAFAAELHGLLRLVSILFLLLSVFELVADLLPGQKIPLPNGSYTYSDGTQLLHLYSSRNFSSRYRKAARLFNRQQYEQAAGLFQEMIDAGELQADVLRPAAAAYFYQHQHHRAEELLERLKEFCTFTADDYATVGVLHTRLGRYQKAIAAYDQALALEPYNMVALNNLGYTYLLLEQYKQAIPLLNKAIAADASFAYSYNNRGLARIKTGQVEQGLADIRHSLALNSTNAYAYLHLGIYHLDRGEHALALEQFEKARALDSHTLRLEHYISSAQQHLAEVVHNYD